jgi:hypothetical protein
MDVHAKLEHQGGYNYVSKGSRDRDAPCVEPSFCPLTHLWGNGTYD